MELELVALLVSGASFLLSVAALWATVLKRARIGVHHAAKNDRWASPSWRDLVPIGDTHVGIALYAHNGGANPGIIETLTVSSDAQRLVADEAADIEREEAFARRLAAAPSLRLRVAWTYARPGGILRGSKPKIVADRSDLEVSVNGLRDTLVKSWSRQTNHAVLGGRARRLAALAAGREPSNLDTNADR